MISFKSKVFKLMGLSLYLVPFLCYAWFENIIRFFIPRKWKCRKRLEGKNVLITGAGNGVGRQLAVEFSKYSTRLILLDINKSWMFETTKLLKPNTTVFCYECDVSNRQAVDEVAKIIKKQVGNVDILVNNAGILNGKRILGLEDDRIQNTLEVNTLAHFWMCKAFLPEMMDTNDGHIVAMASMGGLMGCVKLTDYCASKFAIVGFMESLRLELEALKLYGVKVTVVCPTFISTEMSQGAECAFTTNLKPEYVAQEIIQAVKEEKEMLLLPGWITYILLFKWMLPTLVVKRFAEKSGCLSVMDNFTGISRTTSKHQHQH